MCLKAVGPVWLARAVTLAAVGIAAGCAPRARPWVLKVWPVVDYENTDERVELRLLGPLVELRRDASERMFAMRPLVYLRARPGSEGREAALLYPLTSVRWSPARASTRVLGLFSLQSRAPLAPGHWDRRLTVFPFVFYRHSAESGSELSILPFYADLQNFLGYQRIRTVLFPLFFRLEEPMVRRSWVAFPFFSWTGGTLGKGWRVWPLYGWEERGEGEKFRYVLWPFYIRQWHHRGSQQPEVRTVVFPFYARSHGPALRSTALLGPFFTHSVDTEARLETWGFPWPLWVLQRRTDTGERLALRIAPFYGDRRQGDIRSRFLLWPLYRERTQEGPDHRYERRDVGLVLWRRVVDEDLRGGHWWMRHALFPLWRAEEKNGESSGQVAALYDALVPWSRIVREVYAPLWRLYGYRRKEGQRRQWSLLWNLVSSAEGELRYPVDMRFGSRGPQP